METLIGSIAGKIWQYLNEHGEATILEIKFALGYSNSLIFLGLGWLFRENKITLTEFGYTYKVSLKPER